MATGLSALHPQKTRVACLFEIVLLASLKFRQACPPLSRFLCTDLTRGDRSLGLPVLGFVTSRFDYEIRFICKARNYQNVLFFIKTNSCTDTEIS